MKEIRRRRVESLIQEEIASMVLMNEIKDPRIDRLLSVTDVTVSRDYQYAKVYVSLMGERKESVLEALNHAAGFIQKTLGRRIRLRSTPKLTFLFDESIERGFRITQTLKEISP